MNKLHLEILTPNCQVLDKKVDSVNLQGSSGRLGILPDHTPLIAKLSFGVLAYTEGSTTNEVLCGEGIVEVQDNRVNVVVRSAEIATQVDVDRAKRAKERAKSRLNSKDENLDANRAERALERANNRLDFGDR